MQLRYIGAPVAVSAALAPDVLVCCVEVAGCKVHRRCTVVAPPANLTGSSGCAAAEPIVSGCAPTGGSDPAGCTGTRKLDVRRAWIAARDGGALVGDRHAKYTGAAFVQTKGWVRDAVTGSWHNCSMVSKFGGDLPAAIDRWRHDEVRDDITWQSTAQRPRSKCAESWPLAI